MTGKPNQSEERDRALARLLAEALRTGASADAAGHAACPDAELVAAYAEGPGKGLDDDERELLEGHFAACGRCQETLAVLAASMEEALGERAAVAAAPARSFSSERRERPAAQRWFWWLAPALGTAAAAMLWMVLRPASPGGTAPVQTAADYSQAAEQETRALSAPAAPSAAAGAPPAAGLRRDAQSLDGNLTARAEPEAQAKQEAARDEVTALSLAAPAETAPVAPAARSAVAVPQAAPLVGGATQGVTVTEEMALVAPPNGTRAQTAPAPAPPAAPPAPAPQATQAVTITEQMPLAGGARAAGEPPSQESLAQLPVSGRNFAQLNLYTFSSPDGSALWRLGAGGSIERSTDRGQAWQAQTSGVTADLVSGSAASNDVAWVVGRTGIILRTTDGANWQRIAAPEGATGDWVAVVAYNAMTATAVAADLRRFSTADGGRTWTPQ